jgi:DNA-binding MarR family transcriptional regulator
VLVVDEACEVRIWLERIEPPLASSILISRNYQPSYLDVKRNCGEDPTVTKPRKPQGRDHVDAFLEGISDELPAAVDLTVEGIVERIQGINWRIKRMHEETLDQLGLTLSDWRALTALRWAGKPYRRTAGELARRAELTTGSMTARLDHLEREGLVRRLRDPDDRRSVFVELTDKGRKKHEQAMGIQAEKETLLAEALSEREKEQLNALLRRVMVTLEDRVPRKHD